MKKHICILLFIISVCFTSAQKNYLPGYIIKLNGDTVFCSIDYRDWAVNPKSIQVQVNNTELKQTIHDISGFGIIGIVKYETVNVTYHLNPISGNIFPTKYMDETKTEEVFLKLWVSGEYSLYELISTNRVYYFIKHENVFSELIYRVKQVDMQVFEDVQYKNYLQGLLELKLKLDKYKNRIENLTYTNKELSSVLKIINSSSGEPDLKNHRVRGKINADLFIGGLLNTYPGKFSGINQFPHQLKQNFSGTGGINFIYSLPTNFYRLKFGLSVSFYKLNNQTNRIDSTHKQIDVNYYETTVYKAHYSYKQTVIAANLYVMYVINPVGKYNFFVKGGMNYSVDLNKNQSIYGKYEEEYTAVRNGDIFFRNSIKGEDVNYFSLRSFWLSLNASAGIIYKRNKIELNYAVPADIVINSGTNLKISVFGLFYSYQFLK